MSVVFVSSVSAKSKMKAAHYHSFFASNTAGDDFYIVDQAQFINTYENDSEDILVGHVWAQMLAPLHGGAHPLCLFGGGCNCVYCTFATPPGDYTGLDLMQYREEVCCGNPDGPPSNTADVLILWIGHDPATDAGKTCPTGRSAPPRPSPNMGGPVNTTNGNMWLEQGDYTLPGPGEAIQVSRFYNSVVQTSGLFGLGWSTAYDESLGINSDDKSVRFSAPDGRASYFGRRSASDSFASFSPGANGNISKNTDGTYELTFRDGGVHKFDSSGKLLWQKDRNGNQTTLNYTSGVLTGITDAVGRTLTVTMASNGHVQQLSDGVSTVATYAYDSTNPDLLTSVTYNDGSKFTFEYDVTTAYPKTLLTTVKDHDGRILESHAYDSSGRALNSQKQGGVDAYTFAYDQHDFLGNSYTSVTDANSNVTNYFFTRIMRRTLLLAWRAIARAAADLRLQATNMTRATVG